MIITATFIGENGSLGYENGKEYELKLSVLQMGSHNPKIGICNPVDASGKCQYSNIITFLKNWSDVKQSCDTQDINCSASRFYIDLMKLINNYCKKGLKKSDLVAKMEYATDSCKMS